MRLACDTGGTFTDLMVEDDDGKLHMFKASTVPANPVEGVLNACALAADAFGLDRPSFLKKCDTLVHGTTHAINAIVTKRAAKTALLVSEGHPDILVLREGGRTEPFDFSVRYPDPYIPRALTFEVPERIMSSGEVRTPLDEDAVRSIAKDLKSLHVEAVAICLLWSVANGDHEKRVREILAEELPSIPVTLSHELVSSLREYRRCIATAMDASLKPIMTRYISGMNNAMKEAGFDGRLFVLTSEGNMVDASEVAEAPILCLNSGPSMAPIGGAHISGRDADENDVVIFDTGGTTFDVSLVRDNRVPMTQEMWLGRPYASDMTGFPSVDVRSIGSGGGSIAWVDAGGMLHVGPQSAGSTPGPVCYGKGGEQPTVTDAALALGHIDPDFFLGGLMKLDRDAAIDAIMKDVAAPMGISLERAASAILDVWTENMVQAISDITVNQGIDPAKAAIIGGGGAAGMNAVKIAKRLGAETLIIPETGAALSAFGAIISDVGRNLRRLHVLRTRLDDKDRLRALLDEMRDEALSFGSKIEGATGAPKLDWFVEARYPHQVWEIDVPIEPDRVFEKDGDTYLEAAFHEAHKGIFGYSDEDTHIEAIAWRVAVSSKVNSSSAQRLSNIEAKTSSASRKAYFAKGGWAEVPVFAFTSLDEEKEIEGPALVESPFTSVVIDPDTVFKRTKLGSLIARPRKAN